MAIALGAYGQVHDPTGETIFTLFFTATLNMKAWLATVSVALAVFQLLSAMRLYGKVSIPHTMPSWLGDAHRLSGTLALLFSLPVAYHCLWSLGFETDPDLTRRFVHSVAGCAFYGAFVAKVIAVRSHRLPEWALPLIGGTVFTLLVVVWVTSSLWFFRNVGFPEI